MKYVENDMAAYAESMPLESQPGSSWNYQDGNTLILSRLIQDALGGDPDEVLRFARRELFGPLGMRHVTLQLDGTGTIEGSSEMLASARDWARFGQLYIDDGMAGGRRILPEGWVAYSASPTPKAWVGYGAGFWTNRGGEFWRYLSHRAWRAARSLFRQGIDWSICDHRAFGAADCRPLRPLAESASGGRRRVSAGAGRDRGNRR